MLLIKSWSVNCQIKYQLEIPGKNDVRKLMNKHIKKMEKLCYSAETENTKHEIDLNEANLEDCLNFLTTKDIDWVDPTFKPEEVSFRP